MSNDKSTALAVTGGVRLDGMGDVFRLATELAKARGFVPDSLAGNAASIAAVILTGIELGMGPMESMRGIHVVKGKPTMSAELMLARARKAGVRTRWVETTDLVARLAVTVPGDTEAQVMSFAMADAQRAGIASDMWKKYPGNMLRARCVSNALRAFCPEVLGSGVYESTSGELTDGVPSDQVETSPSVHVESVRALPETVYDDGAIGTDPVTALLDKIDSASTSAELDEISKSSGRSMRGATAEQKLAVKCAGEAARIRVAALAAPAAEGEIA